MTNQACRVCTAILGHSTNCLIESGHLDDPGANGRCTAKDCIREADHWGNHMDSNGRWTCFGTNCVLLAGHPGHHAANPPGAATPDRGRDIVTVTTGSAEAVVKSIEFTALFATPPTVTLTERKDVNEPIRNRACNSRGAATCWLPIDHPGLHRDREGNAIPDEPIRLSYDGASAAGKTNQKCGYAYQIQPGQYKNCFLDFEHSGSHCWLGVVHEGPCICDSKGCWRPLGHSGPHGRKTVGDVASAAGKCTYPLCILGRGHRGQHVDESGKVAVDGPTVPNYVTSATWDLSVPPITSIRCDVVVTTPHYDALLSLAEELTREIAGLGMSPKASPSEERARRDLISKAMKIIRGEGEK